jgi:hypothetical protein
MYNVDIRYYDIISLLLLLLFVWCVLLYCSVLQCSTMSPGMQIFAINNNKSYRFIVDLTVTGCRVFLTISSWLQIYVHKYIYSYMYIHTYVHTNIYAYVQTCIRVYVHTQIHTKMLATHTHTHTHTHIHVYKHARVKCIVLNFNFQCIKIQQTYIIMLHSHFYILSIWLFHTTSTSYNDG